MKAITIKNKKLYWEEVPNPQIKADEVLIKISAAAINRADIMQTDGEYPPPPGAPAWPGLEISGEIVEISEKAKQKSRWKNGDKVCALLSGGGYAEYVAVPYYMVMPIPENISMIEASALPEAFATGYLKLIVEGKAKKGDTVLVQAGASGIASVIIPMAKALGFRVLTTVLNETIAQSISHLNADVVIDTSKENLASVLKKEAENGKPVNVVVDCLGGKDVTECLPYVSYGCRWIIIATLAGDIAEINLRTLFMKNIRLIGSTLRSKTPEVKAEILSNLVKDVWPLVAKGDVRPKIFKVYPITEVTDAHQLLRDGKSIGKVVLTISNE